MLKKFLPQKDEFFTLFENIADIMIAATEQFYYMLNNLDKQQDYVEQIALYEQQADQITYDTFHLLHKTFITPFDRHDIHNLASGLDDILDLVNRCSQRFPFYNLSVVPIELIKLAELSNKSTLCLSRAIRQLHLLSNHEKILENCQKINIIESDAHKLVIAGEKNLFLDEQDFKQFFKLKEVYSQTKLVINRSKNVANMIKGIVLEYS
jgi:uncharacterized protein Yka (UPF0111/DUF47 family)